MPHWIVFALVYGLFVIAIPGTMLALEGWFRLNLLAQLGWKVNLAILVFLAIVIVWPANGIASVFAGMAATTTDATTLEQQVHDNGREWNPELSFMFEQQCEAMLRDAGTPYIQISGRCAKATAQAQLDFDETAYRSYEFVDYRQLPDQFKMLITDT
jgi:hypothetical protein